MNDLNLVTFFKASFEVKPYNEKIDSLWEIVCALKKWLSDKYNRGNVLVPKTPSLWSKFKNGGTIFSSDEDRRVFCRSLSYNVGQGIVHYWAANITENPKPNYDFASRSWITDIVFRSDSMGRNGHFDLVVKYRDRAGYIGHYEGAPIITVPRLIRLILENTNLFCHSRNIPLLTYPTELRTGDGMDFKAKIFNPVRDLPIIYISPKTTGNKWTDSGELLIDPEKINECVMGNAFVFFSKSIEFSEELDYLLGKQYLCHHGCLRVYFPMKGDGQPDDPKRHRLIFHSTIIDWGEDEMFAIFRKALAQNSDYYKRILDYDTCSIMKNSEYHKNEMMEKIAALKKRDAEIADIKISAQEREEQIFELALEESEKNSKLEQEKEAVFEDCNRLEDENSNLKQDLYNAKRQLDELSRKNAGGLVDENSKRLLSRLKTIPTTCQDVVKVLEAAFPDRIVFTSRAYKSLDDCVTTPKLLWELLYGMATDFYDLLQTKPISAGEDFARNSGFEYSRNAGSMTRKSGKLMRNYEDSFEGKSINIEKHFKKGNKDSDPQSIRVYFEWNPEISYKIIIGHCGKHIDNWSSRGIH